MMVVREPATLRDGLNALRFLLSYNGFPMEISSDPSYKKISIFCKDGYVQKILSLCWEAIKTSLSAMQKLTTSKLRIHNYTWNLPKNCNSILDIYIRPK